uniref:UBA domain-containing protein n=1 Tax=Eutreptiella gymnastica TaxID=73025 RepID=A0A7S4G8H4_9EUGL
MLALNPHNQELIATAGGIRLVALVRSGTDGQKEKAASALSNLALNTHNQERIATAEGIEPLVALVRSGTDGQKEDAADALRNLAFNTENQKVIATAGGIEPLVALVNGATEVGQKENAGHALFNMCRSTPNKELITKAGGIGPKAALARSRVAPLTADVCRGACVQKVDAAVGLLSLNTNTENLERIANGGGVEALDELSRSGTSLQKIYAATALERLRSKSNDQQRSASQEEAAAKVEAHEEVGLNRDEELAVLQLRDMGLPVDLRTRGILREVGYNLDLAVAILLDHGHPRDSAAEEKARGVPKAPDTPRPFRFGARVIERWRAPMHNSTAQSRGASRSHHTPCSSAPRCCAKGALARSNGAH